MNNTERLLNALEELVDKELKRFHWYLCQGVDAFPAIPKSRLQQADRADTVDIMVAAYKNDGALTATVGILKQMNQNALSERLAEEGGMQKSTSSLPTNNQTKAPGASSSAGGSAEDKLRAARKNFVRRATDPVLDDLLDELLEERVMNQSEVESVKAVTVRAERARTIIDMVVMKGPRSCSVMMVVLRDRDTNLYSLLFDE